MGATLWPYFSLLCPACRTRGHGLRISKKVPERRAWEVDQRPGTKTRQVS